MQRLSLAGNKIESPSGVAHPLLESLVLDNNNIRDASALTSADLPSLTSLSLSGNKLKSLASIGVKTLARLEVSDNELETLDGVEGLAALTHLDAKGNRVQTLDPLASLANLESLDLSENSVAAVEELTKLRPLTKLKALTLAGDHAFCSCAVLCLRPGVCRPVERSRRPLLMVSNAPFDTGHALVADCPVAEEGEYRLECLVTLPSLETVDGEAYEEDERTEAAQIRKQRAAEAAAETAAEE